MGWRSLRLDLRLAHFVLESAIKRGVGAFLACASSYQFCGWLRRAGGWVGRAGPRRQDADLCGAGVGLRHLPVGAGAWLAGLSADSVRVPGRFGAAPDGSLIGRAEQIDAVGDDAVGSQVDQALGRPFVVDRVAQGAHTQCVDLLYQGDIPQRVVAHQRLAA